MDFLFELDTFEIPIGVLAGAHATITVTPDRESGLGVFPLFLSDPAGNSVAIDAKQWVAKGNGFVLNANLPTGGTWKLVVRAKPGPEGSVRWSAKIRQPRHGTFSVD